MTIIRDEETGELDEIDYGNLVCCGDYVFEFYQGDHALSEFSLIGLEFLRGDAINHGRDTILSRETHDFLKSRFGLVDDPKWEWNDKLGKSVMVSPIPKNQTANKTVDPTPGNAPRSSGSQSQD